MNRAGYQHSKQENNRARLERAALELEQNTARFSWQVGQLARALPQLREQGVRRGAAGVLKGYFFGYRGANGAKYEREIDVALPIDSKIPFEPKELPVYISFVGLWISGVNFLKKEFGKGASADIGKFVTDLAALYPEAAEIFRNAQTSFERTGDGGLKFKILRAVDASKNAAPSLHVEVAAHTCYRIADIIDAHAKNPADYESIKELYFRKVVEILESVLLVKQHVVMDIGVGLAVLSGRDKLFTADRAEKMVNAMFEKNSYGMDPETVRKIHTVILEIYDKVTKKITAAPSTPLPEVIVGYLKEFDAEKSTRQL